MLTSFVFPFTIVRNYSYKQLASNSSFLETFLAFTTSSGHIGSRKVMNRKRRCFLPLNGSTDSRNRPGYVVSHTHHLPVSSSTHAPSMCLMYMCSDCCCCC